MTTRLLRCDAAVIGGGPAGCTAAILLRRANPDARIILFERERFPRHHIGESTLPDANFILDKLGVIDAFHDAGFIVKCGITYKWQKDKPAFTEQFSEGIHAALKRQGFEDRLVPDYSWQVERGRYDQILLDRAREVGVEVHEETAVSALLDEYTLEVRPRDGEGFRCAFRHLVDASGQARRLSNWRGLGRETYPLGSVALYRYYEDFDWDPGLTGSPDSSKILFCASPRGWMWFIPQSPTRVSVGLVTRGDLLGGKDPAAVVDEEIAAVPEIARNLRRARQVTAPWTSGPPKTASIQDWSYRNATVAGEGWYMAGDAAAFVDPILSSGMNLAHHSGMMAANAITTEWRHPEVPTTEIRRAYQQFYFDMYEAFLSMARWWYGSREAPLEDWWKNARSIAGPGPGVDLLSDKEVFMAFVAGYVTDFRFAHIGAGGFGSGGVETSYPAIADSAAGAFTPGIQDFDAKPRLAATDLGFAHYYGTDVRTDRWWKLPALEYRLGGEITVYRPEIPADPDVPEGLRPDVPALLLQGFVRQAGQAGSFRELVKSVRDATLPKPNDHWHSFATKLLSELVQRGVIVGE